MKLWPLLIGAFLLLGGCCGGPYWQSTVRVLESHPASEADLLDALGLDEDSVGQDRDVPGDLFKEHHGHLLHLAHWYEPAWEGAVDIAGRAASARQPPIRYVRVISVYDTWVCLPMSTAAWVGPSQIRVFVGPEGRLIGWLDTTVYHARRRHQEARATMPELQEAVESERMWEMSAHRLLDVATPETVHDWVAHAPGRESRAALGRYDRLVRLARYGERPADTEARCAEKLRPRNR